MDLISVVIPVFNTNEPLRDCLKSVLAQTYDNLEILLVDDHSTEQVTLDILQEFVKQDNRVSLLTCPENGGLAVARNIGINHATGAYLAFLDSDDQFEPDFIEKMHKAVVDNHTDFAVCHVKQVSKDNSLPAEPDFVFPLEENAHVDCIQFVKEQKLTQVPFCAYAKLFDLKKLKEQQLFFVEELRYAEDQDWLFRVFCSLESFSVLNYYGVKRLVHAASLSHGITLDKMKQEVHAHCLKCLVLMSTGHMPVYRLQMFKLGCDMLLKNLRILKDKNEVDELCKFASHEFKQVGFIINAEPTKKDVRKCLFKSKLSKLLSLPNSVVIHTCLYLLYEQILASKK